jgi:glycosyltransferase involved in cell wall biosynthesis
MKIYGLIPAYNEEKNVAEVVARIKKVGIDPVVIDDCSPDGTFKAAKKTGAVVLKHSRNRGKAEAIKTGLRHLENKDYDHVVFIDSDLQYPPEESVKLIGPLKKGEADFVAGHRNWKNVPHFRHRLGNFVWRNTFNILFGTKLKDTNCGFVAMNKKTAKLIQNKIYGGYILENSLLIEALKNGLRVKQVPVSVFYNHKSEVRRGIRVVAGVFLYIVRAGLKYRLGMN